LISDEAFSWTKITDESNPIAFRIIIGDDNYYIYGNREKTKEVLLQ